MKTNNDNFNFFVDDLNITKGKDGKGKEIMNIGGVASTVDEDSDGEYLDPTGFDVKYFLNNGFFNYNHMSKTQPKAIIGEPTHAKATKKGLEIKGYLYADSELAKEVYDATKMLAKSSGTRRMGFSIEGKALERDPYDNKRITKARITGCAITANPKNPNTLVNIIKGEYHDDPLEYADDTKESDKSIEKSEGCILQLQSEGKTLTIDKDFKINISDNAVSKAMSVEANPEVVKEDVDKNLKITAKNLDNKNKMTKGEVYNEIFNYIYPKTIDIEKAHMIYDVIKATAKKRNNMESTTSNDLDNKEETQVSKEDIVKSMEIIKGFSDKTDDIEKGKKAGDDKSDDKKPDMDESYDDKMEKAYKSDKNFQKMKGDMDDYMKKAEGGGIPGYPSKPGAKDETMQSDENAASIGKEGEFIKKAEDGESLEKGTKVEGELLKTEENTIVADLIKGLSDDFNSKNEETNGILKAIGTIAKASFEKSEGLTETNDEIKKSLGDALDRIKKVEDTPIPSKTVQSQSYVEHNLEKSIDASKTLSVNADRGKILNMLDEKAGFDTATPVKKYSDAMISFEQSGVLSKAIIDDLKKSEDIDIVG